MIATRDIAKGEELVNDYGALSNAELLRAYGYVERLAPAPEDGTAGGDGKAAVPDALGAKERRRRGRGRRAVAHSGPLTEDPVRAALNHRLRVCGIPGNSNSHVQVSTGRD